MRRGLLAAVIAALAVACVQSADAADIVVVNDETHTVFFGYYGAAAFVDQPEELWDDTVTWAVYDADPDCTTVLLYTADGTVSDTDPLNLHPIGFYNLLNAAGYNVLVDDRANFASRTDYTGINLIVFPNFGDTDAGAPDPQNAINSGLPFITMEPGHSDDVDLGTGVTVFSGTLNYGFVVDNDHDITDEYGLFSTIWMDQNTASGTLFDIPTDGITTDDMGLVLIGDIPEPATMGLFGVGVLMMGLVRRKRT